MLVSKTGNISMLNAPFKEAKVPVLNTGDSNLHTRLRKEFNFLTTHLKLPNLPVGHFLYMSSTKAQHEIYSLSLTMVAVHICFLLCFWTQCFHFLVCKYILLPVLFSDDSFVSGLNYFFFLLRQEMRVCMRTMFRIVKWALSSMPSMPWLTASMICTRSCAQARRGSAMP